MNKGIKTLGIYTANSFDPWRLAGRAKASFRAHVMADLLDVPKCPQSKSGVTAIREKAYEIARNLGATIDGNCIAARERQFQEWARDHITH